MKELLAGIVAAVLSVFGGHQAVNDSASNAAAAAASVAPSAIVATSSAANPSFPGAEASSTIVYQTINQPVIERIVERTVQTAAPTGYVTQEAFTTAINELSDRFGRIISGSTYPAPATTFASGGVWNAVALTNRIDHLSGTSLSDITVDGVSGLTDADIPDGITASNYLPLTGGTVTGALSFPYITATSTTATSTFSGNLLVSGNLYQNNLQLASSRLAFRDLLFYDDFNRADTAVGELGTSASGATYDMRGVSAQVGNAVTQIDDGRWISAAGDVTYAIQTLPTNVTRMGGRVSWTTGNGGASTATFAMLISPVKTGSALYLNAGAHIVITRSTWTIQYIDNGTFTTVRSGSFSSALSTDGTSYPFEITVNGPVITYNFAGVTGSASSPYFVTHAGTYATWEHYYGSSSVADLLRIEAIWAGTTPVSSGNLYDAYSTGNVGVGTTTPWGKLSVTNTGSTPSFVVEDSASSDSTPFIVDATGAVGIGIAAPFNKLTVYENIARTSFTGSGVGTALIVNANGTGNYAALDFGNSGSSAAGIPESRIASIRTSSGSFLQFGTTNNYSTGITNTAMTIDSAGKIGVSTTTPWRTLSVTGTVGFDGITGSTGAGSLCLSANKEVVYNSGSDSCLSSTRATKHDILPLDLSALDMVTSLQPVSFIYNNDASSTVRYGFIAEDAAAVDAHLATYNAAGTISGIDDRSVIALTVRAVQSLISTISAFADRFTTKELTFTRASGDELTVKKLCVEDVCVTRDQFLRMVEQSGQAPAPSSPTPSEPSELDEPQADEPILPATVEEPEETDSPVPEVSEPEEPDSSIPEASDAPPTVPVDTPEDIPVTEPVDDPVAQ